MHWDWQRYDSSRYQRKNAWNKESFLFYENILQAVKHEVQEDEMPILWWEFVSQADSDRRNNNAIRRRKTQCDECETFCYEDRDRTVECHQERQEKQLYDRNKIRNGTVSVTNSQYHGADRSAIDEIETDLYGNRKSKHPWSEIVMDKLKDLNEVAYVDLQPFTVNSKMWTHLWVNKKLLK